METICRPRSTARKARSKCTAGGEGCIGLEGHGCRVAEYSCNALRVFPPCCMQQEAAQTEESAPWLSCRPISGLASALPSPSDSCDVTWWNCNYLVASAPAADSALVGRMADRLGKSDLGCMCVVLAAFWPAGPQTLLWRCLVYSVGNASAFFFGFQPRYSLINVRADRATTSWSPGRRTDFDRPAGPIYIWPR